MHRVTGSRAASVPKRTGTALPYAPRRDASPSDELAPRTVRTSSYGSFINLCIDFHTASDDPTRASYSATTISGNLAPEAPALLENFGKSVSAKLACITMVLRVDSQI